MSDFTTADYITPVSNAERTGVDLVDLRDVDTDTLRTLRQLSAEDDDDEGVAIIDSILSDEVLESNADEGSYDGDD